MKKSIVIFSNPFGYGPTGKAIAIAESFIRNKYPNIIFAGSSFAQEILPKSIPFVNLNERDENDIKKFLKQIDNPVVISSQNRFAIRAAKFLGIPSAFLDGLAWFWKDIPTEHLIADEIFWMNYPHIENKLPKNAKNIQIVPAIIDTGENIPKQNQILVHIGGCQNPLTEISLKYYLTLLIESLSGVVGANIIITGGKEAIEYLNKLLEGKNTKITAVPLAHNRFIEELSKSKHFITTAGQTATLEAFALKIPTSFLAPMNLSQLALTDILSKYGATPQLLSWNSYISEKVDVSSLNEKDAIVKFNRYSEIIYNDDQLRKKFSSDLKKIVNTIPSSRKQLDFINRIGISGADKIRNILVQKWNLK